LIHKSIFIFIFLIAINFYRDGIGIGKAWDRLEFGLGPQNSTGMQIKLAF